LVQAHAVKRNDLLEAEFHILENAGDEGIVLHLRRSRKIMALKPAEAMNDECFGFARKPNMPPLHDVDTMRNPQGKVRELLDQQHADAIRGELPDHRNQPGHDHALRRRRDLHQSVI